MEKGARRHPVWRLGPGRRLAPSRVALGLWRRAVWRVDRVSASERRCAYVASLAPHGMAPGALAPHGMALGSRRHTAWRLVIISGIFINLYIMLQFPGKKIIFIKKILQSRYNWSVQNKHGRLFLNEEF